MNTNHIKADRKIQLAATGILLDHVFFGDLLAHLKKVPSTQISTFRTDGESIEYNPEFVDTLTIPEIKFILAHETLHVALTHHLRRKGRDHKTWNEACDYVTNNILLEAGFTPTKDALINKAYSGMSTEEIYHHIHQERQPVEDNSQGSQGQQSGGSGNDQQQDSQPQLSTGEFTDGTAKSEAERARQEADWKIRATQAAQAARSQGKLPGSLSELVEEILKPKANWKAKLRDFVSAISQNGYTMNPPNRRLRAQGISLPSRRSRTVGHIVIGVDTSASVSSDELAIFTAEINSILEEHPEATATVIQCDTEINKVEEFENADLPLKITYKGRGGTDFSPVFSKVSEIGMNPDCLVYLTDLECYFPEQPEYPVLWASVSSRHEAPWGSTIYIDE